MPKYATLNTPSNLLIFSLICTLFILYPEITWIPYEMKILSQDKRLRFTIFFFFRYGYYVSILCYLICWNLNNCLKKTIKFRLVYTLCISGIAFSVYGLITFIINWKVKHFGSLVLFQFFFISMLAICIGYISRLYQERRKKEQEIELLKLENLQSRYDALMNQINPHFFFNSLNGLTSLIRKKEEKATLTYINKLSDVFRYILQNNKKGLVSIQEELKFLEAFRYLTEVRFANKLEYTIQVRKQSLHKKLPYLSLMPLLDNIIVHNRIDSDHKMLISIYINQTNELVISNPMYSKLTVQETNGTGLNNLDKRFYLLCNQHIRTKIHESRFYVYLPLK